MRDSLARVQVPAFADADPVLLNVVGLQLEFAPGVEGLWVFFRAAAPHPGSVQSAYEAFWQMVRTRPWTHPVILGHDDADGDGIVSFDEFSSNYVYSAVLAPDVQLFQQGSFHPSPRNAHKDALSLAMELHFKPCGSGDCRDPNAVPSCFDRKRNGDESDIDCGGSCRTCAGGNRFK